MGNKPYLNLGHNLLTPVLEFFNMRITRWFEKRKKKERKKEKRKAHKRKKLDDRNSDSVVRF